MFGSYPPTVDKSYRTSKLGQKLVLFPESDGDKLIIDSAKDSEETFRVSSYCISEQMDLDSITLYLSNYHIVLPHKYDECLYFYYDVEARERVFGTTAVHRSEIFIFDYGVIVMWNLSKDEEQRFIDTMAPFTKGLLNPNDIDSEELSFLYDISEFTQPRIFNDVITLIPTNPYNPLVKLTISHGLGQSVKLAFFENIMEETIISTVSLPKTLAQRGKVNMNRTEMMMIIGKLYRLKMNVNLISNVLGYLKLTQILRRFSGLSLGLKICIRPFAVRWFKIVYLEISQRAQLLNKRSDVLSDLLEMLNDQLSSEEMHYITWIIIVLIFMAATVAMIEVGVKLLLLNVGVEGLDG